MTTPVIYLDPYDFGQRLQLYPAEASELQGAQVYADRETGVRWLVRMYQVAEQARAEAAAAWLYRQLGVASSEWRLVELRGLVGVAQTQRREWTPATLQDLQDGRPADLWLANQRLPEGARVREVRIPGLASTLRLDCGGCLGWDGPGQRLPAGEWSTEPAPLERAELTPAARRVLDRLAALPEQAIMHALTWATHAPRRAEDLAATLIRRRDALIAGA